MFIKIFKVFFPYSHVNFLLFDFTRSLWSIFEQTRFYIIVHYTGRPPYKFQLFLAKTILRRKFERFFSIYSDAKIQPPQPTLWPQFTHYLNKPEATIPKKVTTETGFFFLTKCCLKRNFLERYQQIFNDSKLSPLERVRGPSFI